MNILRNLSIVCTVLCTFTTNAQHSQSLVEDQRDSLINSHKIIYIDGKPADTQTQSYVDSVRNVISAFYYDQFRHFSDPAAPYFLFMSKDAQLAMGIGGSVRMRAFYDWGGAMPATGFIPYLIPMHPDPAAMKHFDTTPSGTCLFFKVFGRNKALGEYQLYIQADFSGYQSRDFKLKKAYATINDFTIGYANSTFSDPAAIPPTVDAQGPSNKISPSAVLVRYMHTFKKHWVIAASAETPNHSIGASDNLTKKVDMWMPDWAAFGQYQWGQDQHVRLSTIIRTLSYRDLVANHNYNTAGWGIQLSTVSHPTHFLTLYGSLNYGAGYAGMGGDLSIGNYDLIANPESEGRMYAPTSFGWCLGLQYNILHNLFVSANASQSRYLPSRAVSPDEYKYGIATAVNVFWNMTPRIQLGAEFDFGMKRNFSGEHRNAKRAGLMCMFSF